MTNDKDIQKDDFILPGNLGTVIIASEGAAREITKVVSNRERHTYTITIGPASAVEPITEDADFEILQPKQIENENTKTS